MNNLAKARQGQHNCVPDKDIELIDESNSTCSKKGKTTILEVSQNEDPRSHHDSDENLDESEIIWNKTDKKMLLEALQVHGEDNVVEISKMLPHMREKTIRYMIRKYSVMSSYLYEDELIDKWMKCGLYRPGDSPIPEALLFIKLFENHPALSESNEYEFRAIYDVLYNTSMEEPVIPSLSDKNWHMLFTIFSKMDKKYWPESKTFIWEYLSRVYNKRHIWKVYSKKRVRSC